MCTSQGSSSKLHSAYLCIQQIVTMIQTHHCVSGWSIHRGLTEEMRLASASLMGVPGGSTSGCLQMESNTSDVLAPLKGSWPKIHW